MAFFGPIEVSKLPYRDKSAINKSGGDVGIRTLETLARLHDFQSCSFSQLGHISAGDGVTLLFMPILSNIFSAGSGGIP